MFDLSFVEKTPEREERLLDLLFADAERKGVPFIGEPWQIDATEGDTFLGGVTARCGKDMVFVQYLAVSPEARGRGLGKRLMLAVEDRARAEGKRGIWLDTFMFQAPEFYKSLGYREFGRLKEAHSGHDRLFFVKDL